MNKEYRIPKNIKPQDLVRGIINASFWHWETIDEAQHAEAIKYLNNLESIDNAKPSGALKSLEVLEKIISPLLEPILAEYEDDLSDKITANYFVLKQALLKAQEQEKVLEILKDKLEFVFFGRTREVKIEQDDSYHYVYLMNGFDDSTLPDEEFDLLKGWLG